MASDPHKTVARVTPASSSAHQAVADGVAPSAIPASLSATTLLAASLYTAQPLLKTHRAKIHRLYNHRRRSTIPQTNSRLINSGNPFPPHRFPKWSTGPPPHGSPLTHLTPKITREIYCKAPSGFHRQHWQQYIVIKAVNFLSRRVVEQSSQADKLPTSAKLGNAETTPIGRAPCSRSLQYRQKMLGTARLLPTRPKFAVIR